MQAVQPRPADNGCGVEGACAAKASPPPDSAGDQADPGSSCGLQASGSTSFSLQSSARAAGHNVTSQVGLTSSALHGPSCFVMTGPFSEQGIGHGLSECLPAAALQAAWMLTPPPHLIANSSWNLKLRLRQMCLWSMPGIRSSWSQVSAGRLSSELSFMLTARIV